MSRFANFGGESSSEEDSDSDQGTNTNPIQDTNAQASKLEKLNEDWKDSDDEEDEERVIKSGATKRAEAIAKILEQVKKHSNTGDFGELENDLASMEAEVKKNGDDILEEKGTKLPIMMLKVLV